MTKTPPVILTDKDHPEGFTPKPRQPAPAQPVPDRIAGKVAARTSKKNPRVYLKGAADIPEHLKAATPPRPVYAGPGIRAKREAIATMVAERDARKRQQILDKINNPTPNALAMKRIGILKARRAGKPEPVEDKENDAATTTPATTKSAATTKPEATGQSSGESAAGVPVAQANTAKNVGKRVRSRRTGKGAGSTRAADK